MTRRSIAIVGAGPSGLYAAQALLADPDADLRVDVLDRLPTPFGLVRYGVAPDHTSIKAVVKVLARVFEDPRVTFYGLVELGRDVTRDELLEAYDAVIYAAGASEDRRLGVPGESLPGSRSGREFVAWYSGHPDAHPQSLAGVSTAVTFGVGNVAVDVARILLADADHLEPTDMPQDVIDELRTHRVRDVWVIGRRGPQHASFTTVELRELLTLPGVQPVVDAAALADIDETDLDRRTRSNLATLRAASERVVSDARARVHVVFWRRPVEFAGEGCLERVVLERTELAADGEVVSTGVHDMIEAQLVLRAIGYRGKPLPGVPFDAERSVIPNVAGRVTDVDGTPHPREFVVGWIKRGPIGVIGTNKSDAVETVKHLLADLPDLPDADPTDGVAGLLVARGLQASSFEDWQRIDAEEERLGGSRGRARTKLATWFGLHDIVRSGRAGGPLVAGS